MKRATVKVEIYQAKTEWRWRIIHRNGNNIANGSEGYKRKSDCKRSLIRLISALGSDMFDLIEP
jgi:uncharacterized protein YegP (UPF0339 family)